MATKNKNRHRFLDDVTYLPTEEYEFGVVADKPGKPKNKQFGQRVYAERHPRLTPEQWQEYWGNQGAAVVNNARDNFAKTVMPYALSFINPEGVLATLGGIAGEKVGGYLGKQVGGNKGEAIGSFVGGLTGGLGSTRYPYDINRNIKNRNLFAYKYIEPFSYDKPVKRGLEYLKHIIKDESLPDVSVMPNRDDITSNVKAFGSLYDTASRFRDVAWRKYLGLPELDDLYIPNGDGTWSYNLNTAKRIGRYNEVKPSYVTDTNGVVFDYVTGNGGNVKSTIRELGRHNVSNAKTNRFAIQTLEDVWDLNPFGDLRNIVKSKIRSKASNIYSALYNSLYKHKIPYNYLGGRVLNKLRYGDYENVLDAFVKPLSKIEKFEVGPLLKGKPFTMRTNIPFTEIIDPTNPYSRGFNYVEGINGL